MSGARGEWHGAARSAAEAVEAARESAEQLALFGQEAREADEEADRRDPERRRRAPGRPKGSRNAAKLGLSAYMAAQGWRAPGEALAQAAGLGERGDGLEIAFRRALWLQEAALGALDAAGPGLTDVERTAVQTAIARDLMSMTVALWREQNAAANNLLPYTLQRLAPLEKAGADAPPAARIGIAPPSTAVGGVRPRLLPADLRIEQNQGLGDGASHRPNGQESDDAASD